MHKAYSEIMDRIIVTDQMRERILDHIQEENLNLAKQPSKKTWFQKNRQYIAAAACLAVFAAGAVSWNYVKGGNMTGMQPFDKNVAGDEHPDKNASEKESPGEEPASDGLPLENTSEIRPADENLPHDEAAGNMPEKEPFEANPEEDSEAIAGSVAEKDPSDENAGSSGATAGGVAEKDPSDENAGSSGATAGGVLEKDPSDENAGSSGSTAGGVLEKELADENPGGDGSTAGNMPENELPAVKPSDSGAAAGSVPGKEPSDENVSGTRPSDTLAGGLGHPFRAEVYSVQELSEAVGFTVSDIQGLPFESEKISYYAYQEEMAEIVYEGNGQQAVFRKSQGGGDNSGDDHLYDAEKKLEIGGRNVLLKGSTETYVLAVWEDGMYAYSLSISSGQAQKDWETIIKNF